MSSAARDAIRAAVLNATTPQAKIITFFGQEIEVRQPTLGVALDSTTATDRKDQVFAMMLNYCFVPGTEEKVFEDADHDSILKLPFGQDVVSMQTAIAELTTVNVGAELKN